MTACVLGLSILAAGLASSPRALAGDADVRSAAGAAEAARVPAIAMVGVQATAGTPATFAMQSFGEAHAAGRTLPAGGASAALSLWDRAGEVGVVTSVRPARQAQAAQPAWPQLPSLAQARDTEKPTNPSRKAIVPALMSAVVPGAGQWKNGATLRALGFAAVELTGWVAYLTFKDGADEKRNQMGDFAERWWDYERYHEIAPDPAACEEAGCPKDEWSAEADSLIVLLESRSRGRFLDYITRDAYACGWDTPTSRHLYQGLWDDREDLQSAASFSGRMIFLNHLVSAVDAFLGARKLQVRLNRDTAMTIEVEGVPDHEHPRLMLTSRLIPFGR